MKSGHPLKCERFYKRNTHNLEGSVHKVKIRKATDTKFLFSVNILWSFGKSWRRDMPIAVGCISCSWMEINYWWCLCGYVVRSLWPWMSNNVSSGVLAIYCNCIGESCHPGDSLHLESASRDVYFIIYSSEGWNEALCERRKGSDLSSSVIISEGIS